MFTLVLMLIVLLAVTPLHAQTITDELKTPQQVAQLGRGTADTLDWHPDGKMLAVGGSLGLWLYDDVLADLAHIPETGEIAWLVWSPDGDQLATTDRDDTVRVWDVTFDPYALSLNRSWTFDDEGYLSVRFEWSPDGERLAVITSNGAQVLDVDTGETLLMIPDLEFTLAWHPDGTQIAGTVDLGEEIGRQVRVWDATSGEVVSTYFGVDSGLFWSDIIWSPDGTTLVGVTSVPAALHAWDVERGDLLNDVDPQMGEFGATFDIWWLGDGAKFVTAERYAVAPGREDNLEVWETSTWMPQRNYFPIGNARQIAKKSDVIEWTVATRDGQLIIWSFEKDEPLHIRSVHGLSPSLLVWSSDNQYLAATRLMGESVYVWKLTTPAEARLQVMSKPYPSLGLEELRWRDDGSTLIGILENSLFTAPGTQVTGFIVEWDTQSGEFLRTLHETPGHIAHDGSGSYLPHNVWSEDFTRVATIVRDEPIAISTVITNGSVFRSPDEKIATVDVVDNPFEIAWSPDNTMLAVITRDEQGETSAWVYNAETGALINHLRSTYPMTLYDMSWSSDSSMVALVGSRRVEDSDETEYRLDIVEVDPLSAEAVHITSIVDTDTTFYHAWHPESGSIAVTTASGIGIYAVESAPAGTDAASIVTIPDVRVYSLAWSPDGRWLAGSHEDGTVRIWDVTAFSE